MLGEPIRERDVTPGGRLKIGVKERRAYDYGSSKIANIWRKEHDERTLP